MLAGIQLINQKGLDRVSVGDIVTKSKLTRPTFYSYFEGANGLFAAIWLDLGPEWLDRLVDINYSVENQSPQDKQIHRALVEILTVAHRISEVQEVVEPVVENWWNSIASGGEFNSEKKIWIAGIRLGIELTMPIDPNVVQARGLELAILSMGEEPKINSTKRKVDSSFELPGLDLSSIDPNGALLQAAVEVISRSGVPAASMARIARKAKVSTGAVYPKFKTVETLIDDSFAHAVEKISRQNFASNQEQSFTAEAMAKVVLGGFSSARRVWRNFRLEIHLEARHRKSLAKIMAQDLKDNNDLLIQWLSGFPYKAFMSGPAPYAAQAVGMGFAILMNAGVPVKSVNHFHFMDEMVEAVRLASTNR